MNDLSKNLKETANCYIISEQGNYEFPLVYGCGIYLAMYVKGELLCSPIFFSSQIKGTQWEYVVD